MFEICFCSIRCIFFGAICFVGISSKYKKQAPRMQDTFQEESINYFRTTIDGHSSLGAREQVSEELLGVVRLRGGLTQTVDEDGGAAVCFQHGADESLEKDEELLGLG